MTDPYGYYDGIPPHDVEEPSQQQGEKPSPDANAELDEIYPVLDWHIVWAANDEEIPWLVDPIFERGKLYALFSKAGTGKSLLVLECAAAFATGRPVLGNPSREPMVVLYVDFENDPVDLVERLCAFGYGPADLGNLRYLSFPSLPALDSPRGGKHLTAVVDRHGAQVVVIDTVSRTIEGPENDNDTFHSLYRNALLPLKSRGVTVIRLDHAGKDDDRGQRGASAKDSDVDVTWKLEQTSQTTFRLVRGKHRNNHNPEYVDLTRKFMPLRHVAEADTDVDPAVAAIIRQLDSHNVDPGLGRNKVRPILTALGIEVSNQALSEAIKKRRNSAGIVRKPVRDRSAENDLETPCPQDQDSSPVFAGQPCPGQGTDIAGQSPSKDLSAVLPPYGEDSLDRSEGTDLLNQPRCIGCDKPAPHRNPNTWLCAVCSEAGQAA